MGSGKSSVGRRVARALSVPFTDTDTLVVRDHGQISEVFRTEGEAAFRSYEEAAVMEGLRTNGVVALGGGAVLSEATRRRISEHRVVRLTVDEKTIAGRLRGSKRPLLNASADPVAEWTRIKNEREPLYIEVADVVVDTSHGPLQWAVDRIVEWLKENR
ncbi:MAG: shikimate kinase [Microbacterium sp.]